MHRALGKLLQTAEGASEFAIAVNLDIRGFSAFATQVESAAAAVFIKKVYLKIIDSYFKNASFFKPMGDGLLVAIPYKEETLAEIAPKVVGDCLRLVSDFGNFCAGDPMVNFPVPQAMGIGVSRGSVCRLHSNGKTLDYSGRFLNLASRLMDLARPGGVVIDGEFQVGLLTDDLKKSFSADKIFIKGIAEKRPHPILYTKEMTRIAPSAKRPIDEIKWDTVELTKKLWEIQSITEFILPLNQRPLDPGMIEATATYPKVFNGRRMPNLSSRQSIRDFRYEEQGGRPQVILNFANIAQRLVEDKIKRTWSITFRVIYPTS